MRRLDAQMLNSCLCKLAIILAGFIMQWSPFNAITEVIYTAEY
jgi:hypothetical protein